MAIPLQSMLQDVLAQIRASKGDAGAQTDFNLGSFRAMTDAERAAKGIDPRDPNQYSINDEGRTMGTLIGFNPNQDQNKNFADMISKLRDGWAQPVDNARSIADRLMRGGPRRAEDRAVGAANAAIRGMSKGQPNFFRPKLPQEDPFSMGNKMADKLTELPVPKRPQPGNKAIPKLERVSPGMYRNAKGNLVRK